MTIEYAVPTNADLLPLTVEFFLADESRAEGRKFLGSSLYEQAGEMLAILATPALAPGAWLVATATDRQANTSVFSASVPVDVVDAIFGDRFERRSGVRTGLQ
jgi:hypothetical protein